MSEDATFIRAGMNNPHQDKMPPMGAGYGPRFLGIEIGGGFS